MFKSLSCRKIVDIIAALTESVDAGAYWRKINDPAAELRGMLKITPTVILYNLHVAYCIRYLDFLHIWISFLHFHADQP